MPIGIATLDGAGQQAERWIDEVDQAALTPDRQHAYRLLRATLHTLRDWMNVDQAADLGAQLPVLIRGLYYEGWNPSGTPRHPHGKQDFVDSVQSHFAKDPLPYPELEIGAVLTVLNRHVDAGQLVQMRNALPKPLRELWPAPAED